MSTWNLALVRVDPSTQDELQHDTVMTFDDVTSPHTLGGTLLALAFTTTVELTDNGDSTFDFTMFRGDPYTGDPVGELVILQGFVEDPEALFATAADMRQALRNGIVYVPELVEA